MFLKILDDILTKDECDIIIEKLNYNKMTLVHVGIGNYFRFEDQDSDIANKLWTRIKNHLPLEYEGFVPMFINSKIRYSKYEPGMKLGKHMDGRYMNNDLINLFTLNIFLNDQFEGGETAFTEGTIVKPKIGRGSLFDGRLEHQGNIVQGNCKYLIRTDVMALRKSL